MSITDNIKEKISRHPEFPVLLLLFALYMFLANFFVWSEAFKDLYLNVSGGSDPYFNYYIVQYILSHHSQLIYTKGLAYPLGTHNFRPPFYQWSIVFTAYLLSPLLGLTHAGYYAFMESDAFYGALLIIPVYLITKEIFGKKAGMLAALFYAIMPGNLTSGILSDGRAHTPELIFAFLAVYFFEMAVIKSNKSVIIKKLTDYKSYYSSIANFYRENKISTIYALMSAVSLGGLIVIWQGFPYIEVIILIYVALQLLYNLFKRKPTGYLTYLTTIYIAFSFPFGYYYYDITKMLMPWYYPPLAMGLLIIGFGLLINIISRKPWIITVPALIIVSAVSLFVLDKTNPVIFRELITGDGYFIKTRLYSTIAEAAAPPLGSYISDFGPGLFLLGVAGVPYIVYKFLKVKNEAIFLVLVFAIFSIFMSFEAGRFNVTAAPAYAILGGGLIAYFADLLKANDVKKRISHSTIRKSIKGNITWIQVVFAIIVVLALIVPSGMGSVSAAVPDNNAGYYNSQINSTLSPLGINSTAASSYLGDYGLLLVNNTDPLAQSFSWLATQNTNESLSDRPAYVSWWDYGFEELQQGKHPTVADDFQQGYVTAGQILLAQNQSQIISLFITRVLQTPGAYSNGHFNKTVENVLDTYFGTNETNIITDIYANPLNNKYDYLLNTTSYGNHQINITSASNARHALIMGQLSTKYSMNTITNAYSALEKATGSKISYIQVDHGLFPFSGSDPGIFYAPAYLTDTKSYTYDGEVVPTTYYDIFAETSTGVYPLNETPAGATITGYEILYSPQFYNSTIYRTTIGYTPQDVGETVGIPGISYGTSDMTPMPAFNMSHFELVYYGSLYNPYNETQIEKNPSLEKYFKFIPLQTAYKYQQENKGYEILLPLSSEVLTDEDPIIQYYPGANITGHVLSSDGKPIAGVHVTLTDQYGIPHDVVTTNATGYYNIVGLPGNDTLTFSTGTIGPLNLTGNVISTKDVNITEQEANDPYTIHLNETFHKNKVSGHVELHNVNVNKTVETGNVTLYNSTYNRTYNTDIKDGYYSFNDLSPYTYSVTVSSGGLTYKNVETITAVLGKNVTNNININFDNLTVNVNTDGNPLSDYNVTVNTTGYIESSTTGSNGDVTFGVIPGNYTITVKSNNTENLGYKSVTGWGSSYSASITPELAARLYGNATNNVTLYFNGISSDSLNVTPVNGTYSTNLPYGMYTVYSTNGTAVFIKTINVTGNTELNIHYLKAIPVHIDSYIKNHNNYTGFYEVLSKNIRLQYDFNNTDKNYTVYLPEGQYTISGLGEYIGARLASFDYLNISAERYIYLNLNTPYNTTVLASSNNNVNQEVTEGIATVYYHGFPFFFAELNSSQAIVNYPAVNKSYVDIQSIFYYGKMAKITNSTSLSYLAYQNTYNITFNIKNTSKVLSNFNGTINLESPDNTYNINFINGVATYNIAPGIYYTSFSSKDAYITPEITGTTVIMKNQTIDKNTYLNFSLTYNKNYTTYIFKNSTEYNINHFPAGKYTVYSYNGTTANITSMYINKNTTYTPIYKPAYDLNVTNSLNTSTSYIIDYNSLSLNFTGKKISLVLPENNNYTVSTSGKYSNKTGAYTYYGNSNNIYLTKNTSLNLILTTHMVPDYVNGYVTYNNSPAGYAYINVISNGTIIKTIRSNSSGYYNVSLQNANAIYGIYITGANDGYAYMNNITLKPFTNVIDNNITLIKAHYAHLYVYYNNKLINNNVKITGPSELNVNSSIQKILLPENKFTISSSKIIYNSTYKMDITYNNAVTEYINSTEYVNLHLKKVNIFNYTINAADPNESVGSTFITTVKITNNGNTANNLTLYSGNSTWKMLFSTNNFYLTPNENKTVNVTVTVPDAPAGINNVSIVVNNTIKNVTAHGYITVNVSKYYSYTVNSGNSSLTEYTITNGTLNMLPVTIKNTGNVNITVYFNITNNLTLNKVYRIGTYTVYNGKITNNIKLLYNQTATVYVYAYDISSVKLSSSDIIHFHSYYNSTLEHNVTITPEIQSALVNTGSSGNSIIDDYTANPAITIYTGIGIIVVAMLVGLIGSSIRSRKKR